MISSGPGGTNSVSSSPERIRVLHVDDDPAFLDLTAEFLEQENDRIEVITETAAADALDRLDTAAPDCIVSDYQMSGMDGLEFLETVREGCPELPFILFTGRGSEEVASDAITAGATDYLQKESGTDQYTVLSNRIRNAVERTRARTQQQRQLAAIETAQEGISILDESGRFVYVNETYADLYGYEPGEMLGEHWELLYPDDEVAFVREEVVPAAKEQGNWHGRTTGLRSDGTTFPEDHAISATDDGGLVCTVRDVSEHEARKRKLERTETIIDSLGDPIYALDADGRITYANDAFVEKSGHSRDALVGDHVSKTIPEADVERGRELVQTLLGDDTRREATWELELETVDGGRIPVENHLVIRTSEDGEFRGTAGILRDISERRERERELEMYRAAVEEARDGIAVLDADGTYRMVNEIFTEVVGLPREEVIGNTPADLTDHGIIDESVVEAGMAKALELLELDAEQVTFETGVASPQFGEEVVEHNLSLIEADAESGAAGSIGSEEILELPPGVADTGIDGAVITHRKVTERKERERELQRHNERLDEFANILAHELRNPLQVASNRVELLGEHTENEQLPEIESALERMDQLIDDVRTFAKHGQSITDPEPVDIASVARNAWAMAGAGDDATLRVSGPIGTVHGDRNRIQQLFENLFRNALDHGRPGATVRVGPLESAAGIYVEDDGPGIPTNERERVFDYGYSTSEEGTGFGLAIVQEIVSAHGWTVAVTDGADGGARFEITGLDGIDRPVSGGDDPVDPSLEMSGKVELDGVSREDAWDAFADPAVLSDAIPGCEFIAPAGERIPDPAADGGDGQWRLEEGRTYVAVIQAGIGSIKPRFESEIRVTERVFPRMRAHIEGNASRNVFSMGAEIRLDTTRDGAAIHWRSETDVSGRLAGMGDRVLSPVAERFVDDFFADIARALGEK